LIRPFKRFTTLKPGPLRRILREALITGDFFISPKRVIFGLEAVLKDIPFEKVEEVVERFFSREKPPDVWSSPRRPSHLNKASHGKSRLCKTWSLP
jgi:hypothetical protein